MPVSVLGSSVLSRGLAASGIDPDPEQARRLLRDELAKADYAQGSSLLDRLFRWLVEHFQTLDQSARSGSASVSPLVTGLLAVAVVAVLAFVLPRIRRERTRRANADSILDDPSTSATAYRDRAGGALRESRFDDALLDWFRAMARETTDRTLLSDAPGQTAHEMALALTEAFPAYAERLTGAADRFDAVRYGRRPASREQTLAMRELDRDVSRSRPARVPPGPVAASRRVEEELPTGIPVGVSRENG